MLSRPIILTIKSAGRLLITDRLATVPSTLGVDAPPFVGPWFSDIRRDDASTTIFTENGGEITFGSHDLVLVGHELLRS
jgi:hypothetical protein